MDPSIQICNRFEAVAGEVKDWIWAVTLIIHEIAHYFVILKWRWQLRHVEYNSENGGQKKGVLNRPIRSDLRLDVEYGQQCQLNLVFLALPCQTDRLCTFWIYSCS